jgi:mannose-6-phosphate isomerase-like protein (cupin superfamily)
MAERRPPFPGAIGASHLRVYDTISPDGLAGGTPHLHTVCTEAYFVVAGTGAVQTLTASGYAETELEPGGLVWFTPGTIHRLVNRGGLEILVLMQNAGLPESGDMVITFPHEVVVDADAYTAAAVLPENDRTTAGSGDAARVRRDRGVEGFVDLRDAVIGNDMGPLEAFHRAAAALVLPRLDAWNEILRDGPVAETARTDAFMAALAEGDPSHLAEASVHSIEPHAADSVRRMGCCGTLGTYVP